MDPKLVSKLEALGMTESLPGGREGVRVALHYEPRLSVKNRDARRAELGSRFAGAEERIRPMGAIVDPTSLSVSGQSVEAVLPIGAYDDLVRGLADEHISVTPLVSRTVTC